MLPRKDVDPMEIAPEEAPRSPRSVHTFLGRPVASPEMARAIEAVLMGEGAEHVVLPDISKAPSWEELEAAALESMSSAGSRALTLDDLIALEEAGILSRPMKEKDR